MHTAQATMVVSMSEGRVTRYKKDAKADMIRNNKTQIRCPCRTCKLQRWIDPDSGQLEDHLLRRGFMRDDFDEELTVNGVGHHEDLGGREDESLPMGMVMMTKNIPATGMIIMTKKEMSTGMNIMKKEKKRTPRRC